MLCCHVKEICIVLRRFLLKLARSYLAVNIKYEYEFDRWPALPCYTFKVVKMT